jgi:hypothetical protein
MSKQEDANVYVLHENYGRGPNGPVHLVRCPDGSGKTLTTAEAESFLRGKTWRKAR